MVSRWSDDEISTSSLPPSLSLQSRCNFLGRFKTSTNSDQRHRLWSERATEQNPAQAEARQANYDDSTPHQVVDSGLTGGRNDTSRFTKGKPIVYPGKSEGKVESLFYKDN